MLMPGCRTMLSRFWFMHCDQNAMITEFDYVYDMLAKRHAWQLPLRDGAYLEN